METKKTTPRVLSWSTVKDRKLDATSTRLKHSTHETKPLIRTIPQTDRLDASTVLDRQSGHFFPLGRLMAEPQASSTCCFCTRHGTSGADIPSDIVNRR
eukprot:3827571-Rhodomonas_salina.3